MVVTELDRFVIKNGLMPTMNPDTINWCFGSLRGYLLHLHDIGLGDFVLMKFNGSYYSVPAENSTKVFLKGGVYVNE